MLAAALLTGCKRGEPQPGGAADGAAPSAGVPAPRSGEPAAAPVAPGKTAIARREVVPGKLWIDVFVHRLQAPSGPVPCWTFLSDGLMAYGQKEIAITVKREPGEPEGDYDRTLFSLYDALHDLASEGRLVGVHGFTQLGGAPLLGRKDFQSIVYIAPQPLPGLEINRPYLTALFVTNRELEGARRMGFTRLTARLGYATRYFPTPPWNDRRRPEVFGPDEGAQSMLGKAALTHVSGAAVRLERGAGGAVAGRAGFFGPGDRIVLRVLPRGAQELKGAFASRAAADGLLLLLEVDPGADACLAWRPGQQEPVAIGPEGSSASLLSGNFLLLAGGERIQASAAEDGFALVLNVDAWRQVRQAILAGQPISVPGSDAVPAFAVEWVQTSYVNPVDGSRYEAEGGWRTVMPQASASAPEKPAGPVAMQIVLLTGEAELEERIGVEALSDFIGAIRGVVEAQVADAKVGPGCDLAVQVELSPGKKELAMAMRPEINGPLAKEIHAKLGALPAPSVKGPVKFQVLFSLWGGSGLGLDAPNAGR